MKFLKFIDVIVVPLFDVILCLLMLYSLRLPCFPCRLLLLVKGRVMILPLLLLSSLLQLLLLLNIPLLRYTLGTKTLQSLVQHRLLRHQIQSRVMIFRFLSVKVNVSVLTQSLRLFPITICHLPLVSLLHPWILSLFLTLSVRLYLTLVGVVLWWKKCRL